MFDEDELKEILLLVKSVPLDEPEIVELVQKYIARISKLL